jgi:RHS repeat-associated protein
MSENKNKEPAQSATSGKQDNLVHAPTVSLPTGGGAIHGMGEKFAANPVTGTGSMSIPIATSPGRSGFGPQLSLSYDSGAGNGPFGLGWNLSQPSITRKTDKGLPRYNDAEESDVFILSGAEDLVPVLNKVPLTVYDEKNDPFYKIYFYRPRIEGLFAQIERWVKQDNGETFWRTISKDNITTIFGKTESSRIFDPDNGTHIFSWLISESYDDKGNAILYEYKQEPTATIQLSTQANERNRTRTTNRYVKRIKYGNTKPRQDNEDLSERHDWLFEVVFDYGEHYEDTANQTCTIDFEGNNQTWSVRPDPFSTYRPGFEVRTYRLCRRVLMFHHFEELSTPNYLVKSTEFHYAESPVFSLISSVTQSGYELDHDTTYHKRSLPPIEFTYSQAVIQDKIHELDDESLRNLPEGLDGVRYQWIDLDGEGLTGILTEQADAWYYKRNIGKGKFAEQELVARKPSLAALASGRQQLLDLAGDGQLDLVELDPPLSGFYERTADENWEPFVEFKSMPNIAWQDPNLKFIDLTGDGHADVLISENDIFTWYGSLAEAGFGAAQRVHYALEEESGPRLVFADGTQSIYLADMSGDGLTDLVRIRNREVCYWPNLGYGRFGAKVTMDNAPRFDYPDQFDQRRIRLADIDGSGVVDIIYLATDGVKIYFNQSGNRFNDVRKLAVFPKTDNLSAVQVADLFGNGTACLLWSSPLPGAARRPLRYIDLMGGKKPHLLKETDNNLGGKTIVEYAASTQFYLADKLAGNPWITKLPFPVHVVEKVTVTDKWRKTSFTSTYSYHHGYFDGIEREFRGFGRVEQVDVESYDIFAKGNIASPYITNDKTLFQPPIKTITWYHTGAAIDRERILTQFADEYFPARYHSNFPEKPLPEPELPADLSADEWREALRACKGMVLRQESYELDVDALHATESKDILVRLYSAATHNCNIQLVQKRGGNKHAVFLVTESEAITYNYELDLTERSLRPDPRIAHTLNLRHDEYGNPQQSIAIGYKRFLSGQNTQLPEAELIDKVQAEEHIAYSETHYTGDCLRYQPNNGPLKHYRLRVPCEAQTYELAGFQKDTGQFYFTLENFRLYDLSEKYGHETGVTPPPKPVSFKAYHEYADGTSEQKRLVEHARSLYFNDEDDITDIKPNAFSILGPRGLKYEDYKLALTDDLLNAVFQQRDTAGNLIDDKMAWQITNGVSVRSRFDEPITTGSPYLNSGYILGSGIYPNLTGQYWMRSGTAGFDSIARLHQGLPNEYTDPFGNKTTLDYGPYQLFIQSSTDALGNTSSIERFDYRVLVPSEMIDANNNHTEVVFDVLGLPVAAAIKGKKTSPDSDSWQGDDLKGFDFAMRNPASQAVQAFCTNPVMNETTAGNWLGRATTRFVYHFGDDANGAWAKLLPGACSIARERHVGQLAAGEQSKLQVSLECSDGSGNVLMKKVQAEPKPGESQLQWIINGLTVLNNKGKPVKQYEPYFSGQGFGCEMPSETGVTPIIYYDAAGRTIRTEMPDGTYSRIEFSPWHVLTFDANDTVLDCRWYAERLTAKERNTPLYAPDDTIEQRQEKDKAEAKTAQASPEAKRAAGLAANHAKTPALTFLDSLGRDVIGIAHNRTPDTNGVWQDAFYTTYTKLDAEGKPLWIRDAKGHLVMQYITPAKANNDPSDAMPANAVPCYDIAGNLLFQHSMDADDRWTINDAAGKPLFAWDVYKPKETEITGQKRLYSTAYDALHRPTALWLKIDETSPNQIERFEYQDAQVNPGNNLNGQLVKHYDPSGLVEILALDFKGSPLEVHRILVKDTQSTITDWQITNPQVKLESETFIQITEYDALKRMTRLYNWHRGVGSNVAVYEPQYSERGVLKSEILIVQAKRNSATSGKRYDEVPGVTQSNEAIKEITYDAKGQRQFLKLGNNTITHYDYDLETFRLRQLRTTRLQTGQVDPDFPDFASNLADSRVLQQLFYTYDPVGNITEIEDQAYKPVFFDNAIVEPKSLYEYDALYRLISATGRESAQGGDAAQYGGEPAIGRGFPVTGQTLRRYLQQYRYDQVGNFVTMQHIVPGDSASGWTRHYQYAFDDPQQPASNRLWRTWHGSDTWNGSAANNKVTYAYDSHGSMLNLANVMPGQLLQWDHRDMIVSLDLLGGGFAYYQYDAGKQRTRKYLLKNNGNIIEERIYLGGLELYRRQENGVLTEEIETLHLFDGKQRLLIVDQIDDVAQGQSTLYRYTLSNHLESSTVELNERAEIISYEEYHPYGTSAYRAGRNASEVKLKRYRYIGMERDEESGLNYHSARYYLPWLGRWSSTDTAHLIDGTNLFSYARCNPARFYDKNGKFSETGAYLAAESASAGTATTAGTTGTVAVGNTALVAGLALLATASVAFATYQIYKAKDAYKSLKRAEENTEHLQQDVKESQKRLEKDVEQAWREGYLTDEEYETYKTSKLLPRGYFTSMTDKRIGFYATPSAHNGKPLWLQKVHEGIYFNKLMAFSYQYRELYIIFKGSKSGYSILDFYIPGREIGSRKKYPVQRHIGGDWHKLFARTYNEVSTRSRDCRRSIKRFANWNRA